MFLLFFSLFLSLPHIYTYTYSYITLVLFVSVSLSKCPGANPSLQNLQGLSAWNLACGSRGLSMGFNMVTSSAIKDCSYRKTDNHCYINLDGYSGDLVFWAIGQVPCCIIDHYSSRGIGNAPRGQMSLCQSHVRKSRLNHLGGNP